MSKAILVAGLAYGDEGKGATVDFLCRRLPVDLVVRYNGGSQAAHNVVTPEGVHHTFAQFGSGMLASAAVRTHLSRFMLVDPLGMLNEEEALAGKTLGPWRRTTVDPRCVVITPFHRRLNRLREMARGADRHGSCGMGVGVAREWQLKYGDDVLYAGDLGAFDVVKKKLRFLEDLLCQEIGVALAGEVDKLALTIDYYNWSKYARMSDMPPKSELAVFEGAQGVLLDETHGVEPHRTWTDCTFANADTLCDEAGVAERLRVGCLRTYFTRHGAGPLNNEVNCAFDRPEEHNSANEWQGRFRAAPFDFDMAAKSMRVVGRVDYLALGHMDVMHAHNARVLRDGIHDRVAPVGITAHGPRASDRQFTPAWTDAWRGVLETAVTA